MRPSQTKGRGGLVLAAAQTLPIRGDVAANLEEHERLILQAAAAGVRALVFPELSLIGYELDMASELAFTEDDARLAPLAALATRHELTVVVGLPLRSSGSLYLGSLALEPDGSRQPYTKQHLGAFPASVNPGGPVPPPEASVFSPGVHDPLLDLGEHRAALAICADIGRPAHPEAAAARGADCYFASMFVIPEDLPVEVGRLASYAERHSLAVLMANYGGDTGGLPSAGSSAIWSRRGELLAQLDRAGSGLAIAQVD